MPANILGGWNTKGSTNPSQWQWMPGNPLMPAAPAGHTDWLGHALASQKFMQQYHNLTQPKNWWERGMTSMLPGWKPNTGQLTPPWSPKAINTPVDWALAYGRGIQKTAPVSAPVVPAAIAASPPKPINVVNPFPAYYQRNTRMRIV